MASLGHAYDNGGRSGLYLSGSYGTVDADLQDTGEKFSSPKGGAITLGYRVNEFIAIEGGYTDLGSAKGSYTDIYIAEGPYQYTDGYSEVREVSDIEKATVSGTSTRLGFVVSTNVWDTVSAGLRAGFHRWDVEGKSSYDYSDTWYLIDDATNERVDSYTEYEFSDSDRDSLDGSDHYYGLTAGWRNGNLLLSVDYTVFVMEEIEPSMASLTLGYDF